MIKPHIKLMPVSSDNPKLIWKVLPPVRLDDSKPFWTSGLTGDALTYVRALNRRTGRTRLLTAKTMRLSMTDPVFQTGQKITPVYTRGYDITLGKSYEVIKYEPSFRDVNFTWPPYVHFVDDFGNKCIAHARRFKEITND